MSQVYASAVSGQFRDRIRLALQGQTCPKTLGTVAAVGTGSISLDGMADDMSVLSLGRQHFLWPRGSAMPARCPYSTSPSTQAPKTLWSHGLTSPLSPRVVSKTINTSLDCDGEGKPIG